jgi:O-antigen/teichoic acid export membrane protein
VCEGGLVSSLAQDPTIGIAGRIVRAAGAQGVNQLARVVQLFILVPICLTAWGTALYEDWLLLNSITAFLTLADLGFVQLTTVKLIDAWSKQEQERFSREWAMALGVFVPLTIALTCVLGIAWAGSAWTSFIPARRMPASELAPLGVLLSLANVWYILICLGLGAYRARGDLSRSYYVSTILIALQTGAVALPAAFGEGPVGAAAGSCIVTGATLAGIITDLHFRYPDMRWKPIWPRISELFRGAQNAIGYVVSPLTMTIMLNGPNLILAHSGAPQGAIALFTTSRTIAGVARQLPYQFAHPAGVELARLLARGDREGLFRIYARASRVLAVVVGVLSGFTLIAAPLVMTLWTRNKVDYDPILMLVLVGTTAVCAPSQVAYTLLWYGGYPGRLSRALVFSTGLAMGLALLLAPRFEARGVTIGLGVGEIVGFAVYLSLLVDGLLGRHSGSGLLRNFWTTLLSFLSSGAVTYALHWLIEPRGWLGLVELCGAWTIPAAVGLYLILLSRAQQARVICAATSFVRYMRTKPSIKAAKAAK